MPPPAIYAINYRAGFGNDFQPVRYRVFIVDRFTNRTVATSGWSGTAWAADNSPARFSGSAFFNLNPNGQYLVDYRIEWLRTSDHAVVGWVADRAVSYNYVNGFGVGLLGPLSHCMRI